MYCFRSTINFHHGAIDIFSPIRFTPRLSIFLLKRFLLNFRGGLGVKHAIIMHSFSVMHLVCHVTFGPSMYNSYRPLLLCLP